MVNEQLVREIVGNAPFLKTVGIELLSCGPGTCEALPAEFAGLELQPR